MANAVAMRNQQIQFFNSHTLKAVMSTALTTPILISKTKTKAMNRQFVHDSAIDMSADSTGVTARGNLALVSAHQSAKQDGSRHTNFSELSQKFKRWWSRRRTPVERESSDKKALKSIVKELKHKLKSWTQSVFQRPNSSPVKANGQREPSPTPILLSEPQPLKTEQVKTPDALNAPMVPQRRFTDRIIIEVPPCPPVMPSEWLEIIPVQDDESEIEVVFTRGSMTPMTPLIDQETNDEQNEEMEVTMETLQCVRGVLESMQTEEEKEREYYVPRLRLGENHPLRFISHLPTFRKHYSHLIIEDGKDE